MFFHVSLIILVSKKIDCCTECRQRGFRAMSKFFPSEFSEGNSENSDIARKASVFLPEQWQMKAAKRGSNAPTVISPAKKVRKFPLMPSRWPTLKI